MLFICEVLVQDLCLVYCKGEEMGKIYVVWLYDFNVCWCVIDVGFEVFVLELC